jgi:hypothetical protein
MPSGGNSMDPAARRGLLDLLRVYIISSLSQASTWATRANTKGAMPGRLVGLVGEHQSAE